jgi:hypothetical protein
MNDNLMRELLENGEGFKKTSRGWLIEIYINNETKPTRRREKS